MAIVKRIASEEYADEKALYEALKAVENAPQSDWEQNDEAALDYIKNKPFYEFKVSNIIYDGQVDLKETTFHGDGLEGTYYDAEVSFEEGHIYKAILNNENNEFVCQEVVCEQNGFLPLYVQDSDFYVEIFSYDSTIYIFSTNPEYFDYDIFEEGIYNLKVAEIGTTPKTLDEKFIPDTIARIKNIPQSDWEQNDEAALDYIKNKPFYEFKVSNIIYDGQVDLVMTRYYDGLKGTLEKEVLCEKGKTYKAIFNNENNEFVCQEVVCNQDGHLTLYVQDSDFYVEISGDFINIYSNDDYFGDAVFGEGIYNLKVEESGTTLKTLDEKFIPDTIARVEDIPVTSVNGQTGDVQINIPEQVQSDWNQNDETAVDYVKNRPFYEKTDTTQVVLLDGDVEFNEDVTGPEMSVVLGYYDEPKNFENGKTYTVTIDNERQDIVCENDALIFVSSELNMTFRLME